MKIYKPNSTVYIWDHGYGLIEEATSALMNTISNMDEFKGVVSYSEGITNFGTDLRKLAQARKKALALLCTRYAQLQDKNEELFLEWYEHIEDAMQPRFTLETEFYDE